MKRSKIILFSHKRKPELERETGKQRSARIRTIIFLTVIAATLAAAVIIPQTGFAVSLNGEVVGTVKNVGEVTKIIDSVEHQVSDLLGYDYKLGGEVELTAGTSDGGESDLATVFLDSVEEIEKAFVLEIDGRAVAAAREEHTIREAIAGISERYAVIPGSSVSFDNKVTITYDYAPVEIIKTSDEIVNLLDPEAGDRDTALIIRTVTIEIHEETVACANEYIEDPEVYEGIETVICEGVDGDASVSEQVVYINGEEQSRSELAYVVVRQPVNTQIARGTMFRPRYVSYGEYIWPAEGMITCAFGYRNIGIGSNDHRGIDIGGGYRSDIIAADGGEVIFAENVYSYGNLVKIQHDNGDITWYAHCDEIGVSVGDKVARGDTIAYMGTTGISTGVHLHFEVHTGGEAVDPISVLP